MTSDYLNITEPPALRDLLLLQERGADTRIFRTSEGKSFHMKSYIFVKEKNKRIVEGCAWVGSNNISASALCRGHEWILRHDYEDPEDSTAAMEFRNIRREFSKIFNHPQSSPLSADFVETYTQQCENLETIPTLRFIDRELQPEIVIPNSSQEEALKALKSSRENGIKRGLVVLATGMGKTWLSALDSQQMEAKKLLFVAHRKEILLQAERTFSQILNRVSTGLYDGEIKQVQC